MGLHIGATIAIVATWAIVLLTAFQASGVPAQPGVAISGKLNPSVAQTVQITLSSELYSFQPPNSIVQLGGGFAYSIIEQNTTYLAFNQRAAYSVVGSPSSGVYQVATTISVSVAKLCSGSACAGFVENITVVAHTYTSTYLAFWSSPTVAVEFSNAAQPTVLHGSFQGQTVTANSVSPGTTSSNGFNVEFWGFLFLGVGVTLLLVGFTMLKHPLVLVSGVIILLVDLFLVVIWLGVV